MTTNGDKEQMNIDALLKEAEWAKQGLLEAQAALSDEPGVIGKDLAAVLGLFIIAAANQQRTQAAYGAGSPHMRDLRALQAAYKFITGAEYRFS